MQVWILYDTYFEENDKFQNLASDVQTGCVRCSNSNLHARQSKCVCVCVCLFFVRNRYAIDVFIWNQHNDAKRNIRNLLFIWLCLLKSYAFEYNNTKIFEYKA